MKISTTPITKNCAESEIYQELLSLDNKHILELGCGNAEITRHIASNGEARNITALEVDEIAHQKNLQITDLPNVTFILSGAQAIPLDDETVDIVFMFKSLHHVPVNLMAAALDEIRRVLKPGGLAYISEPIFDGDFNEVLRLFHDEESVRLAAFNAVKKSVDEGLFSLSKEIFFNSPMCIKDFAEFETDTIKATHSSHTLDADLYARVKHKFEQHVGADGAHFLMPMRVDLLQK